MINVFTKNLTEKSAEFSLPQELKDLRVYYKESGIPTILDESLSELLLMVLIKNPENILELGTATGCSGAAMLLTQKTAKLTTIEKFDKFQQEAIKNFKKFGVMDRVTAILGDSYETALSLTGEYDFIFLDCNKASYTRLLPVLKGLLKKGDHVLVSAMEHNAVMRPLVQLLDYGITFDRMCKKGAAAYDRPDRRQLQNILSGIRRLVFRF